MIGRLFRNRNKQWRSLNSSIQDHICQVNNVAHTLDKCVHAWTAGDIEETQQLAKKIFQEEKGARDLKEEIIQCIYASDCSTQSRQDFLRLSRNLDLIGDYSKAASKDILLLAKRGVHKGISHSACEIMKLLLKEMSILEAIINVLGMESSMKGWETVSNLVSEIGRLDCEIHELYYQNKGDWLLLPKEYLAATLIIANNLIRSLVNVANSIDRIAELATVLVTSSLDEKEGRN